MIEEEDNIVGKFKTVPELYNFIPPDSPSKVIKTKSHAIDGDLATVDLLK